VARSPDKEVLSPFDADWEQICLSSDDDLVDYKDTMSRADVAEWTMRIDDELRSSKEHKVWTLIP
jgi:hypothetical protein